jgi:hypothetical protein
MTLIGCDLHARMQQVAVWTPGPAKSRSTSFRTTGMRLNGSMRRCRGR